MGIGLGAAAQVSSVSPYSGFGLGEEVTTSPMSLFNQGGVGIAVADPVLVNFTNPATYHLLRNTTLDFGFSYHQITKSYQGVEQANSIGRFNYFMVGVPLKKNWGLAAGIMPATALGYNVSTEGQAGFSDVVYRFRGTGGLNRALLGTSYAYKEFSLGFNFNYLFGALDRARDIQFADPTFFNSRNFTRLSLSNVSFDAGALYRHALKKENQYLSVGAQASLGTDLNAKFTEIDYTYQLTASGIEVPKDTITNFSNESGTLTLPLRMGFGVAWGKQSSDHAYPAWTLAADFRMDQWGDFIDQSGNQQLRNGMRIGLGGNIVPQLAFVRLERSRNYLAKMQYRAGAYYAETPYQLNGVGVNELGMSFGIGLPLRARNLGPGEERFNQIQFGFTAGRRGNVNDGVVQENFTSFTFGLTLSEKWFIKYKYR